MSTPNYNIGFDVNKGGFSITAYASTGESAQEARNRIQKTHPGCRLTQCNRNFGTVPGKQVPVNPGRPHAAEVYVGGHGSLGSYGLGGPRY